MTVISELRRWIEEGRDRLEKQGVLITDKLPSREDNDQRMGCVGLTRKHILVSFTVWDRDVIATELIIFNDKTVQTIYIKDDVKHSTEEIIEYLNETVTRLAEGFYDNAKPDPGVIN